MKISARFFTIIFAVILLLALSSASIFYFLTINILEEQQIALLKNSERNFNFSINSILENNDEDIRYFISSKKEFNELRKLNLQPDFVFLLQKDSAIIKDKYFSRQSFEIPSTIKEFKKSFPNAFIQFQEYNGSFIYYGSLITQSFIDNLAEKVNSGLVLVVNNKIKFISKDLKHIPEFNNELVKDIIKNKSFETSKYDYLISSIPGKEILDNSNVTFTLVNYSTVRKDFSEVMGYIIILTIIAGITISFILIIVFTSKIRNQIKFLSRGAEKVIEGDLNHNVEVILKDELGRLAEVFNRMVNEIKKKELRDKSYAEILSLLNEKSNVKELSEKLLSKIIGSFDFIAGAIYIYEEDLMKYKTTFGISEKDISYGGDEEISRIVFNNRQKIERFYEYNSPTVKIGLVDVKVKTLLIYPVIYQNNVVAVLELVADKLISKDAIEIINQLIEQLGIGITNSVAYERLKDLVEKLKEMNEEYQMKNKEITEKNEELRNLHKDLQEKTAELEKEKERAVKLTEAKSQFLANMSHELKTPLNSILGLSELLLKANDLENPKKEKINIILRNGKRLLSLINNILEFSKIETGKVQLKEDEFFIGSLFQNIKDVIEPQAEKKNLEFNVNLIDADNILVNTDRDKLELILINLLGNAVKFTDNGYVNLNIHYSGNDLIFRIIDTGIGLSKEDEKKIFEEFTQLDQSLTKKYEGAGLGLAVCKKYAELLKGSITYERINNETHFILKLNDVVKKVNNITEKLNFVDVINYNQALKDMFDEFLKTDKIEFRYRNLNDSFSLKDSIAIILNLSGNFKEAVKELIKINDIRRKNIPLILVWHNGESGFTFRFDEILPESKLKLLKFDSDKAVYSIGEGNFNKITNEDSVLEKDSVLIFNIDEISTNIKLFKKILDHNRLKIAKVIGFYSNKILQNENNPDSEIEEIIETYKLHQLDMLKFIKKKINVKESVKNNLIIEPESEPVNKEEIIDKKNVQVLIVDDDADTLFTMGEIVKGMGLKTRYANNGIECLATLEHYKPDIIFLDIMMPMMDGFEAIKNIRKKYEFSETPIYALTAHAMLENKEVIDKNGFTGLVTKPLNTAFIEETINKTIKKLFFDRGIK